jgi:hypothetical protein
MTPRAWNAQIVGSSERLIDGHENLLGQEFIEACAAASNIALATFQHTGQAG